MNKQAGTLYIITAPSGTGKTSLVNALIEDCPQLSVSVSHTTRQKRQGETDGKDYFFVSEPLFKKMIEDGDFLEYANVYGKWYGTSKQWVADALSQGKDIILEIDWQGAEQVRQLFSQASSIFLLPPSKSALEKRLRHRQQDDESAIENRMRNVAQEVEHCREFDYILINDDFSQTLNSLKSIVQSEKIENFYDSAQLDALVEELLRS